MWIIRDTFASVTESGDNPNVFCKWMLEIISMFVTYGYTQRVLTCIFPWKGITWNSMSPHCFIRIMKRKNDVTDVAGRKHTRTWNNKTNHLVVSSSCILQVVGTCTTKPTIFSCSRKLLPHANEHKYYWFASSVQNQSPRLCMSDDWKNEGLWIEIRRVDSVKVFCLLFNLLLQKA